MKRLLGIMNLFNHVGKRRNVSVSLAIFSIPSRRSQCIDVKSKKNVKFFIADNQPHSKNAQVGISQFPACACVSKFAIFLHDTDAVLHFMSKSVNKSKTSS